MHTISPAQRAAIRESFVVVLAEPESFAAEFYRRVFESAPAVREMFSPDLAVQRRKFVDMLVLIVDAVTAGGPIDDLLSALGERHRDLGVQADHYAVVEGAMIATLAADNASFTEQHREAWTALLKHVSAKMLDASI